MKPPIALISSTVAPSSANHYGGVPAGYDPDLRLQQTRAGIQSLLDVGVEEIYVADNSGDKWRAEMEESLRPARVQVFKHFPYRNKGISELYLLLAALPQLPQDRPIIKVSGRYRLRTRLDQLLHQHDCLRGARRGGARAFFARNTPGRFRISRENRRAGLVAPHRAQFVVPGAGFVPLRRSGWLHRTRVLAGHSEVQISVAPRRVLGHRGRGWTRRPPQN